MALQLPFERNKGDVVAAEPVEPGNEQNVVLAPLGVSEQREQDEPVFPAERLAVCDATGGDLLNGVDSSSPRSLA